MPAMRPPRGSMRELSGMRAWMSRLFGGHMQAVLIGSFSLVAGLTIALNTLVTLRVINNYLRSAESERVARDMDLALAFYQLKLEEIAAISHRLVLDPWVKEYALAAAMGDQDAIRILDQQITNKIAVLALGGTHFIAVLDSQGEIVSGRTLAPSGSLSAPVTDGNWGELPIVAHLLSTGKEQSATEVIPSDYLGQVGLAGQARIPLIDTPLAYPDPFDPREGSAGFTLTSASPLVADDGNLMGAVVAVYLFNNDFTLVDRIKQVAGIDTVTIFFGDLRVSTNVMTKDGLRAVGTRVSQAVFDRVLTRGDDYVGRAFVVNEWFITQYVPLRDHLGDVVGSLYVGARVSAFESLVSTFNSRQAVIALLCIGLAAVIAVPIARVITRPIESMVRATRRLAAGDMNVRVEPFGQGELAALGRSFNSMIETLQKTQSELLHKERLASMGQLAAGVAHEINNPLGTILLFADVMYKEADPGDPRREDLKLVIDETTRCKNIVADLLNFARQQEVLTQEIDIHALADRVIENASSGRRFDGIQVVRRYGPEVGHIQADPNQLQQVFVNLLNNAAEAIDGRGIITISTRTADESHVEIRVADTGCGISQENLRKIFTPFFTTKALGKGTGLGLSIVYGIIKMHRGQISVESKLGAGSTFTILLPMESPPSRRTSSSGGGSAISIGA